MHKAPRRSATRRLAASVAAQGRRRIRKNRQNHTATHRRDDSRASAEEAPHPPKAAVQVVVTLCSCWRCGGHRDGQAILGAPSQNDAMRTNRALKWRRLGRLRATAGCSREAGRQVHAARMPATCKTAAPSCSATFMRVVDAFVGIVTDNTSSPPGSASDEHCSLQPRLPTPSASLIAPGAATASKALRQRPGPPRSAQPSAQPSAPQPRPTHSRCRPARAAGRPPAPAPG